MEEKSIINKQIDNTFDQINNDIDMLYASPCVYTRNIILNQMRDKLLSLKDAVNLISGGVGQISNLGGSQTAQRNFTIEELKKYNGKNGNPAYVAVNGTVYDVTDNAAWAAATHFGLSAGNDLTGEFARCHQGMQQILSKLKVIGRLV